jgi:hypothetical protein
VTTSINGWLPILIDFSRRASALLLFPIYFEVFGAEAGL